MAPNRTTRSSDRVRVIGAATQQDRNRVIAAVRMVNAALPEGAKLEVDPLRTDLSLLHGMSGRAYFVTGDELPDTIHVEFVPGRDPTGGTAAARSFDLVDKAYVALFQASNAYHNEREAIILLAHEIMHALGLSSGHVSASFQSILKGMGGIHAVSQSEVRQPMSVLYRVDREALRVLYSDDAASLGPWASTSFHIHGNAPMLASG